MSRKKNNGFTLVELIVVIVILAILVGVTIGGITGYVRKARINTDIHNAKAIEDALQVLGSDEDLLAYANYNDISSGYSINLYCNNVNSGLFWWRFKTNEPSVLTKSQVESKIYSIISEDELPKSKSGGHFHIDITSTARKNGTLKIRCYACKEWTHIHSTGCTELKPVE